MTARCPLWKITGENGALRWYMSASHDEVRPFCERHAEEAAKKGAVRLENLPSPARGSHCQECRYGRSEIMTAEETLRPLIEAQANFLRKQASVRPR